MPIERIEIGESYSMPISAVSDKKLSGAESGYTWKKATKAGIKVTKKNSNIVIFVSDYELAQKGYRRCQ